MDLDTEVTRLEHPIDAMYLIHKALQREAARVEEMVGQLEIGGSLQPIRSAFNFWAAALVFHAAQEDQGMTALLTNFQPARDNEAEHAQLAEMLGDLNALLDKNDTQGLKERVKAVELALHERQHAELLQRLEDVMEVLNQEIGRTRVIPRTKRHLYGKVVALRITQDDHLESEEAFVLPEVWQRISEEQQLEVARQLFIDESAEDPRWVIDWVAQGLTLTERRLLAALETRFQNSLAEAR